MAMFIRVDIDDSVQQDQALCKRLVEVTTVEENLDECTLCDLCMVEAPERVQVVKLYRE